MNHDNNNNMNESEYLKKHIGDIDSSNMNETNNSQQNNININTNMTVGDMSYIPFDTSILPCGDFYPSGTKILIRPATVKEIQSYSMVDDNNYYDVIEKMDEIISSCVRIKYIDGKTNSYLDLKDPDRYYVTFLIREITFQNGNSLTTKTTCSCGTESDIPLVTNNFIKYEIDEKLIKFFNSSEKCFVFKTQNDKIFKLSPPTIGLQKGFIEYIVKKTTDKEKINTSFLKIIPFTLHDRVSISQDGIKSKLEEFQTIDDMSFQFLNSAIDKLTFGIKSIKSNCKNCGMEVHSEKIFPNGPSGIFIIHDAFERFIKE